MDSFISSLISSAFSCCQYHIVGKAKYIYKLEDNLEDLQKALEVLIKSRDDAKTRVLVAEEDPHKRRLAQVELWFRSVEDVETRVGQTLNNRHEEIKRLCLGGFCSKNPISSFVFGEKVAKLLDDVTTLQKQERDFKDVAQTVPAEAAVELPIDRIIVGQQSTFEEVRRCMAEKQTRIVGLYGLGGVGKTTLLKRINNFCNEGHNFDVVIWIVVSRSPKLGEIQEKIGTRIGLSTESWEEKSFEHKAVSISNILCKKKFVLLLDDIWEPIDLTEMGVPLQVESKIIFTTRSLDVCHQMEADEKIEVKCLEDGEAWQLFQKKVGGNTLDSDTRISKIAKELVNECGGLPLALITTGRVMAGKKSVQAWERAIRDIKTLASKFSGMEEAVYSRLKFSYDNLPNNTSRSCFLYCSLFPEDCKISKRNLIDCWVGEDFMDEYNDGYIIIEELVSACLLEEDDEDNVKMHDVIRDMALWIACVNEKEKENFLVQAGIGLTEAPETEEWKGIKRLSLMDNKIKRLSAVVTCPDLLTLFLNDNSYLQVIADDFFQFLPSLRILNLSRSYLSILPSGISNLVSLQHLDISYTYIEELPKELSALVKLKCFMLEGASHLRIIPRQLMSKFSNLQVLRMTGCDGSNKAPEDSVLFGGCELLVAELCNLKHLNALGITLKSSAALQEFLYVPMLGNCTQSLCLLHFKDSTLDVQFLKDMQNLDNLVISDCSLLEELKIERGCAGIFSIETNSFHSLHEVKIIECPRLCDLTWLILAPNVKTIFVGECNSMEEIISSEVGKMTGNLNPLAKLQYLHICDLPKLERIYPCALQFPHLKEVKILYCPELKKLPLNSNSAKDRNLLIQGSSDWWTELEWEDEATQIAFLPCFRPFSIPSSML